MDFETFTRLLQLTISPVVLISGVGLLLLTVTQRLGRPIDRCRELARRIRSSKGPPGAEEAHQLRVLLRRCEILRWSIGLLAFSILSSIVMVLLMILEAFAEIDSTAAILASLTVSVLSILLSVCLFLLDITLALKALKIEADFGPDAFRAEEYP